VPPSYLVWDTKGEGRLIGVFDNQALAESVGSINRGYFQTHHCMLNSVNSDAIRWTLTAEEQQRLVSAVEPGPITFQDLHPEKTHRMDDSS